jgi:DNA-binding protein H-NS
MGGQDLKEMREQLARLQQAIADAEKHEREQALGQIQEIMYANSITLADLQAAMTAAKRPKSKSARQPKYRDPESGKEWSGVGKVPGWIKGQERERFLIAA